MVETQCRKALSLGQVVRLVANIHPHGNAPEPSPVPPLSWAQVVKKTAAEKAPSLGKWSDRSQAPDASHTVQRDTEYRLVSDPDAVVDSDMRVKAYLVRRIAKWRLAFQAWAPVGRSNAALNTSC